jgi:hypothetical protein
MSDQQMRTVVEALAERFGRLPTDEEVMDFLFGDEEKRLAIWNKEVENNGRRLRTTDQSVD